jgi:hypothetical protein
MREATPTLTIDDEDFSFFNITKGTSDAGGAGDIIRVEVNYQWGVITPLIRPFFTNGQFNVRVSSTMKNEPTFSS